ncbi:hypothetical protein Tco_1148372, partial [Tanacetum coccineum]
DGFGAYWLGSERVIPDKGDLRDYYIEISSDRDFLGSAPSYVFIRDHVRRLCHRMISCSIFGRGQTPEKVTGVNLFYLRSMDWGTANVPYLLAQYLFRHAKGRKSGVRLSKGYFIGHLAAHFRQLGRLNVYERIGDTWVDSWYMIQGLQMIAWGLVKIEGLRLDDKDASKGSGSFPSSL